MLSSIIIFGSGYLVGFVVAMIIVFNTLTSDCKEA
jgi:hypothetical protein